MTDEASFEKFVSTMFCANQVYLRNERDQVHNLLKIKLETTYVKHWRAIFHHDDGLLFLYEGEICHHVCREKQELALRIKLSPPGCQTLRIRNACMSKNKTIGPTLNRITWTANSMEVGTEANNLLGTPKFSFKSKRKILQRSNAKVFATLLACSNCLIFACFLC